VGLTLEEIVAALDALPVDRAPNRQDWKQLSAGWSDRLDQRIALLEALRSGLTDCIGCGCLSLRTCILANPGDAAASLGPGPQFLMGA
jgi:MerR family redox-sensitive transcriptional activator SoxR